MHHAFFRNDVAPRIRWAAAGLLTLAAAAALLCDLTARFGSFVFPSLGVSGMAAVVGVALSVFAVVPKASVPMRPRRFLVVALVLAAAGGWLYRFIASERAMVSPLAVSISESASRAERDEAGFLETLDLPDRRYLVRIAGRRRNFVLDVSGFIRVPRSGTYRFDATCDDACSLRVGTNVIFEDAGAQSATRDLNEGIHPLRLRYRQGAGPASLVLRWHRPAFFQLRPLEAWVSGDERALEDLGFRAGPWSAWGMLAAWIAWAGAASYLVVRAGESKRAWLASGRALVAAPPGQGPTAIVRPRPWLVSGLVLVALAVIVERLTPAWVAALEDEYAVNPVRMPFVLERAENLPAFVLFLAMSCLAVSAGFALLARLGPSVSRRSRPSVTTLFFVSIVAVLVFGAFVSQHEWVRYGRPCYDAYCDYAERVRAVLVAPEPASWDALHRHLLTNYHANSPLGPVLIAGLSLVLPGIVISYRALSLISTLGTLVLLVVIARRHLGLSMAPALAGGFLFAASGSVQRSMLFPQTDAAAMFFFTLAIERVLALRRDFTGGRYAGAVAATTLALFTKLSSLPLVAMAGVLLVWPDPRSPFSWNRLTRDLARALTRALTVLVPPVLAVGLVVMALGTTESYRTEMVRISTLDSRASFHLMAFVVTLLPFLLALVSRLRGRWSSMETMLVAIVWVYLFGLWGSGASGWERFYLNAIPIGLAVAVSRFAPLPEMHRYGNVALLCAAYALGHAVRMMMHLYNGA